MASTCRRNHQASMNALCSPPPARPARWAVVLAFTLVYLAWGTTYLAISAGVKEFPPALFGGTRIGLAGLVLLGFLHWRGETLLLSRQGLLTAALIGNILFTGGNFLVTFGEKFVVSSSAAVLVATTPLWMALLETLAPRGERLQLRGWIGILLGLGGVLVMLSPKMRDPADLVRNFGPLLIIGSAFSWAFGSFLTQRLPRGKSHLVAAAWQMVMGGAGQCLLGVALGEPERL